MILVFLLAYLAIALFSYRLFICSLLKTLMRENSDIEALAYLGELVPHLLYDPLMLLWIPVALFWPLSLLPFVFTYPSRLDLTLRFHRPTLKATNNEYN